MCKSIKIAKILSYTSKTILVLISSLYFLFALLSGSEKYGGGLKGILMNSPNALPWLLLFVLVYIAWKWKLIGGILIALMGLFTVFFFNTFESFFAFFVISFPLIVLGSILIINSRLKIESEK